MKQAYLLIGEIVRPQGIRGEVKVRHYTDDPARFLELKTVFAERDSGYIPLEILSARVQQDDVFLLLKGTSSRNDAEALRGTKLWVDRAHARELSDDEVFIADIIGAEGVTDRGTAVGILKDVVPGAGADIFVFKTPNGTMMMPALKTVILEMNAEEGKIVLDEERLKEVALYEDRDS